MVAGLSTGAIIAMAMDFSIWPRTYLPPPPEPTPDQDQTPLNTQQVSEGEPDTLAAKPEGSAEVPPEASTVPDTLSPAPVLEEPVSPKITRDAEPTESTSSPTSDLVDGVPEEDGSSQEQTDLVNSVPDDDDDDDDDACDSSSGKDPEKKSSSLIHPVPTDDDVGNSDEDEDEEIPRTLLETARQGPSESSLA